LAWSAQLLTPGGFFLMRDKVALSREIVPAYTAIWRHRRRNMPTDLEAYDHYVEKMRAGGDIPATIDAHMEWLRAAGLTAAILHSEAHYFLLAARRPASAS
jgi:predicted metal-dependent phosphoesterase TrpH